MCAHDNSIQERKKLYAKTYLENHTNRQYLKIKLNSATKMKTRKKETTKTTTTEKNCRNDNKVFRKAKQFFPIAMAMFSIFWLLFNYSNKLTCFVVRDRLCRTHIQSALSREQLHQSSKKS